MRLTHDNPWLREEEMARSDTAQDRVVILCERLASATATHDAEWQVTADDTFRWARPEGAVEIRSRDRDGEAPFELTIYNSEGQKVEERASALVDDDRPAPWNAALADLYLVARGSALHADDVIDALIERLPRAGTPVA
jgi:hypothetical protein